MNLLCMQKAAVVLMDEEHSRAEGRGEMSERELLIMDQFTVLVRDLYAFYPLLIRFVDYNRYEHPFSFTHSCMGADCMPCKGLMLSVGPGG